jgi:hypothetical protein
VISFFQLSHGFSDAVCEIPHDILYPPLKVGERLEGGILDLRDLSEPEDVLIDFANICVF